MERPRGIEVRVARHARPTQQNTNNAATSRFITGGCSRSWRTCAVLACRLSGQRSSQPAPPERRTGRG